MSGYYFCIAQLISLACLPMEIAVFIRGNTLSQNIFGALKLAKTHNFMFAYNYYFSNGMYCFRCLCRFSGDPQWSETGDRYLMKLFRDHLFHQVHNSGKPWVDLAHIVQTLNKVGVQCKWVWFTLLHSLTLVLRRQWPSILVTSSRC